MIIIRFSRVGKKGHAQYKVVLAEKSFPVQGKCIEQLGSYDPHQKLAVLKADRIKYWIGEGAACSDSVHNMLVNEGILKADKRKVSIKIEEKEVEEKEEKIEEVKEEIKKEEVVKKPSETEVEKKEEPKKEASTEEAKEEKK